MYGGLTDRVHDLLLCGVDPSLVDLSAALAHLKNDEDREIDSLLQAASRPWTPSHYAFLYGPEFKACIASLCLVKVIGMQSSIWPLFFGGSRSTTTLIDSFIHVRSELVMMQTHLYRVTETECERGSEHVPPYLPFEMWLTIMSFVQVLLCSLEIRLLIFMCSVYASLEDL